MAKSNLFSACTTPLFENSRGVGCLHVVLFCLFVSYVFIVAEVHFTYEVQFH